MNWYQTIKAEQKTALDWQGMGKGLFQGMAAGVPVAVAIIAIRLGVPTPQAQALMDEDPAQAQHLVQTAPPDVVERARNLSAAPVQDYQPQQQQLEPQPSEPEPQPQKESGKPSTEHLANFIAQWEGFEPIAYEDGDSKSVGHGFYLGNHFSRQIIESVGGNFDRILAGQERVSEQQAKQLLQYSINQAMDDAYSFYPGLVEHPQEVQTVVIDMAYNMGSNIRQFPKMRAALEDRDYAEAAKEMKNSRWYGQVGRRSAHHVNLIQSLAQ
jgi:GH24 family phage-related lysozyme (muramidase)